MQSDEMNASNQLDCATVDRLREIEQEVFDEGIAYNEAFDKWREQATTEDLIHGTGAPQRIPFFALNLITKTKDVEIGTGYWVHYGSGHAWQIPQHTMTYHWDLSMIRLMAATDVGGQTNLIEYLKDKGIEFPPFAL